MRLRSAFSVIVALVLALGSTSAIVASAAPASSGASQVASSGVSQNYLVVYSAESVPSNAASAISSAGGTLVYSYNAIGVVLASSAAARLPAPSCRIQVSRAWRPPALSRLA